MELSSRGSLRSILARPWLLAFLPINAATSAFSIALQLLILLRGGAVLDWALAATLFNAAVILASIGWGYLSDHFAVRRLFLLANYAGFAVIYAVLGHLDSLGVIYALYAFAGLLTPAGVSASNLLILEQFTEAERPTAYASFQEMSILGSILGGLVGYVWLAAHHPLTTGDVQGLLYILAALAAASVAIVWFGVHEPPQRLRLDAVVQNPAGLASRIRHSTALRLFIPFFPRPPQLERGSWRRFRHWLRREARAELPLILVAMLLFNLASNVFNVSYTFYLYAIPIGAAQIFLVNVANGVAQAFLFPLSGGLTNREGSDRLVRQAAFLRTLGYISVTGFTFIPWLIGGLAYGANLGAFAFLGGAIALYSTASSLVLFRAVQGRDAGGLLGLNSALGGVAAVVGSFLSGILSTYGSFRLTFLFASVTLLISLPLWAMADVAFSRRKLAAPPPGALAEGGGARTE
jgi:MFS family permease